MVFAVILFIIFVLHLLTLLLFLNLIRNLSRENTFFLIGPFQNTHYLLISMHLWSYTWLLTFIHKYIWAVVLLSYNITTNYLIFYAYLFHSFTSSVCTICTSLLFLVLISTAVYLISEYMHFKKCYRHKTLHKYFYGWINGWLHVAWLCSISVVHSNL